jgi:flagellar biogenesis protein FliO
VAADWTVFLKLGLGSVSLALAGAGLVFFYRRWLPGGNRAASEGDLKVVGRVALSPRHLVYLLQAEGRKVVVGVSGDRLTSLAVLEERGRAAASPAPPPASPRLDLPASARAFGESTGRAVSAADLMPYRRQVNRLREMLRRDGADIRGGVDAT